MISVPVSIGEMIDKLSILHVKKIKVSNEEKLNLEVAPAQVIVPMKFRDEKGYKPFSDSDYTPEEKIEERRILDLTHKLEEQYAQEDTDMLVRLVKIRRSLWT